MIRNPLNIQEKNSKIYLGDLVPGIYPGTKSPFLRPNNFSNFYWLHLVPGTTIEKKNKKNTQVVPGTKYGVFRYTPKKFKVIFLSNFVFCRLKETFTYFVQFLIVKLILTTRSIRISLNFGLDSFIFRDRMYVQS
jgi:hypothetical protein